MQILGFTIANGEKWDRAVNGTVHREGKLSGGVGENATDEVKLAAYDKLGGLVMKGKNKVKMGAFYDFEKKTPREKPEVVFIFRDLEGTEIEVPEGEELPIEVRAAEMVKAKKVKKVKKTIEDEE